MGTPGNTEYACDTTTCTGYLKKPAACTKENKCPAVLIIPDWNGMNDYETERANMLSGLGHVAFAADIYGADTPAENMQDWMAASGKHRQNPALYMSKIDAALKLLKSFDFVESTKVAAIGYCFGGSGIINMAILGSDVLGVVGYHSGISKGSIVVRADTTPAVITTKVLLHSGVKDDDATDIAKLEEELEAGQATYEIVRYGNGVVHSFTEWSASTPGFAEYNRRADFRSWASTKLFLQELFEGLPEPERAGTEGRVVATSATPAVVPPVFVSHFGKRIDLHVGQAILKKIQFKTYKNGLQSGAKVFLRALLQVMVNFDLMQLEIRGFTPAPAADYSNNTRVIQEKRANVCRKYLVGLFPGTFAEKSAFMQRITTKAAGANAKRGRYAEITVTAVGATWLN